MQVKVKFANRSDNILLELEPKDTIAKVKEVLQEAHEVAADMHRVVHSGTIVDSHVTLEALSTGNECTLVLAPQPAASLPSPVQTQTAASSTSTSLQQIIVKTLNGSLHKFMVLPTDSLLKVKYLIEEETKFAPECQLLVFKGKTWVDSSTLQEMGVEGETHTIHLVPRRPRITVKVKMLSGKVMDVKVDRNETVGGLMSKIEAQEGYPVDQQRLIFNGTKLEDRFASLTDKKVDASPTVHLVLKPSGYTAMSVDIPHTGKPLQRGAVGLQNLGNTCFMNSSIQCLSNIPPLRDFFVTGEYKDILNREADKSQGKLAEAFAELLSVMWREDTEHVSPARFKWQVGQLWENFSGYGQQDSMELFEYVLDGLKEDCNKAQKQKKSYADPPDAADKNDDEVAREALALYQQRSDSKVDDLFLGFLKSTVRCPDPGCKRSSIMFDPFLSVKLPLQTQAEEREARFSVIFVRSFRASGSEQDVVHEAQVRVCKFGMVNDLLQAVAGQVRGVDVGRMVLVDLLVRKVMTVFGSNDVIESIRPGASLVAYEVEDPEAFRRPPVTAQNLATVSMMDDQGDGATGSASSSAAPLVQEVVRPLGAVVYQRQPSRNPSHSASSQQVLCELCGVPIFVPLPRSGISAQGLYTLVMQHLGSNGHMSDQPPDRPWKLYKVLLNSPTYGGVLVDPEATDEILPPEGGEQFALTVEWDATVSLPSWTVQAEQLITTIRNPAQEPAPQMELSLVLQRFVAGEQLGLDDAWLCTGCNERKQAWKQLEFHDTPPVLVFQLKRFQYTRYTRERLNIPVAFPLEGLDMSPYSTASAQKTREPEKMLYDLAGVSTHFGGLGGGHYIAHARSSVDGEWYSFDDKDVRKITAEDVRANKVGAYILFYIRRDHTPPSFQSTQLATS